MQALVRESEQAISGLVHTSAFVKNVPVGVKDDLMEPLLRSCGPIRRWKRPLAPNGLPKAFGFVEYTSPDGLGRALRLLNGFPLGATERALSSPSTRRRKTA